ncbi:MAG TPA: DNA repair protein RecN [Ignavibacteriaceae bacterium]|nr:DNA repair protein RecN [Ignavibacteriaceae bacterium]
MLKSLLVKDYALIGQINVEFGRGLNIITGETGAGKSILIDAMSLLLGERASTEVVRKGAQKSIVEGIFEIDGNKKVKNILEENEIDVLPELIMRREISLKGNNRCFLNDTPVTLNIIKDIGDLLVDLHGQHEHQSLLRTDTHIEFLDEFGSTENLLKNYRERYILLSEASKRLNDLKQKENILKDKKDIYAFQIKEIDAVSPEEDEEEKINDELKILENSERLSELTSSIYDLLYESESSVNDQLGKVKDQLEELLDIDKTFSEVKSEYEDAEALISDISEFVRDYKSKIEIDPEHLEELRNRLGAITLLKKKYGGSVKAILGHRKKIGEEFELAENYSDSIEKLESEIKKLRKSCGISAEALSKKRKEISKKVQKEVEEALTYLGIENSFFKVEIKQIAADQNERNFILLNSKSFKCNSSGYDQVEFFISTNPGEDPKPLAKVASGGEISRVMLALKSILAKTDKLPLLIFDEIDTGVSGRIAQKVGQVLKNLAGFHQIISITHLPQIAGLADQHYAVEKTQNEERVVSSIKKLGKDERVKEVAKLMSGEKITEASLKGARELMGI